MTKFLLRIGFFVISVVVIAVLSLYCFNGNKNDFPMAYDEKYKILENMDSPRLLLVGGSTTSMSFNTRIIQEAFPQYNIYNTAITGAFGLKFLVDDIGNYARKDDIILLFLEWQNFTDGGIGRMPELTELMLCQKHPRKTLNFSQLMEVIDGIPVVALSNVVSTFKEKKQSPTVFRYHSKAGFNSYGDEADHWERLPMKKTTLMKEVDPHKFDIEFADYFIERVNEYQRQGIRVFLLPSNGTVAKYQAEKKIMNVVSDYLRLNNLLVFSSTKRNRIDNKYIFDGPGHLNKAGADLESILLIQDMKNLGL